MDLRHFKERIPICHLDSIREPCRIANQYNPLRTTGSGTSGTIVRDAERCTSRTSPSPARVPPRWSTLNRPERRNALSAATDARIDRLPGRNRPRPRRPRRHPGRRRKVFCSGHDLSEMTGRDINEYRRDFRRLQRADAEDSGHPPAGDRRGAGRRHRRRMPTGGLLRPGHRRRRGLVRHARREDRPLLHHTHGGPHAGHRPQARAPHAADRGPGGRANGR